MTSQATASVEAGSWREMVKIHPAADCFPMLSESELDELTKDIARTGLRQPIVYWTPSLARLTTKSVPKELEVYLLDGRNRLEALSRCLPRNPVRDYEWRISDYILVPGRPRPDQNVVTLLLGHEDPCKYVLSSNLYRRHLTLTSAWKRDLIADVLKAHPEKSDRAVGKLIGADGKTVAAVRSDPARAIPNVEARVGATGRKRPIRKAELIAPPAVIPAPAPTEEPPPPHAEIPHHEAAADVELETEEHRSTVPAETATPPTLLSATPRRRRLATPTSSRRSPPSSSPAQQRDKAVAGFSTLLHNKLTDTLDDLSRILRNERGRIIAALPYEQRKKLANAYVEVFGIEVPPLPPRELPPRDEGPAADIEVDHVMGIIINEAALWVGPRDLKHLEDSIREKLLSHWNWKSEA